MFVQRKRIAAFYKELERCCNIWDEMQLFKAYQQPHPDQIFLNTRSKKYSVNFWLSVINERMSREDIRDSSCDPFISCLEYTANQCWFSLALDLQKLLYDPDKATNITWFNICFPKIQPIDHISLKPIFDTSSIVYLVEKLPLEHSLNDNLSLRLNELVKKNRVQEKTNMLPPSYFFVTSTANLYRINPNSNELIHIEKSKQSEFATHFMQLLQLNRSMPHQPHFAETKAIDSENKLVDPISKISYHISTKNLYDLIVRSGGYPLFDLSGYKPNDSRTKIYSLTNILFNHRDDLSESNQSFSVFKNRCVLVRMPEDPCNIELSELKKILSDKPAYVLCKSTLFYINSFWEIKKLTAYKMTANKIDVIINKVEAFFPENNFEIQAASSQALNAITMLTGHMSVGKISAGEINIHSTRDYYYKDSNYKPLPISESEPYVFYNNLSRVKVKPLSLLEFFRIQESPDVDIQLYIQNLLIQEWSSQKREYAKHALAALLDVIEFYYEELEKNATPDAFRIALNKWSKEQIFRWDHDSIQDMYCLYGKKIISASDNTSSHYLFELFMKCFKVNLYGLKEDIIDIAFFLTGKLPDRISKCSHLQPLYKAYNVGPFFNYLILEKSLDKLMESNEDQVEEDIRAIKRSLSVKKNILPEHINQIVLLYKKYDILVKNSEFDHTREQSFERGMWAYLAQLLTGAGYIDDYIKLLCPSITVLTDPVTQRPISLGNLRGYVFSDCRTYFIVLEHAKDHSNLTNNFYNCNAKKPVPFKKSEIDQIKFADRRYHKYIAYAKTTQYGGEWIRISTWLAVETLVNESVYYKGLLPDNYQLKLIKNISEIQLKPKRNSYFERFYDYLYKQPDIQQTTPVYVQLVNEGFNCYIIEEVQNIIKAPYLVSFSALKILPINQINEYELLKYSSQILALLEDSEIIKSAYPPVIKLDAHLAYLKFYNFLTHLDVDERHALDNRVVTINGNSKRFKNILQEAPLCMATAGRWYMAFLLTMEPTVRFSNEIERTCDTVFPTLRKQSARLKFLDAEKEAEQLFVSLMTYSFNKKVSPEEKRKFDYRLKKCVFYDYSVELLPPLDLIFESFKPLIAAGISINLGEKYVDIVRHIIKPEYIKYSHIMDSTQTLRNIHIWFSLIVNGNLFKRLPIHDLPWFFRAFHSIDPLSLCINECSRDLFIDFIMGLQTPSSIASERIRVNIAFIRFLKSLPSLEFLSLLRMIKSPYRKEILRSYVASQGKSIQERYLHESCERIFRGEINLSPIRVGCQPGLFKSTLKLDTNDLIEKLCQCGREPNAYRMGSPLSI
ncbi:MAG: hypothetical protein Q8R83_11360 [Legionellaceae bacterium]|nr:hypothetical protein [Legionellaceae bacterium]